MDAGACRSFAVSPNAETVEDATSYRIPEVDSSWVDAVVIGTGPRSHSVARDCWKSRWLKTRQVE
jgi:hypothetical protein